MQKVRAGAPPESSKSPVPLWLLPPAAVAVGAMVGALLTEPSARLTVIVIGAVATVVVGIACALTSRRGRRIALLRAESAGWQQAFERQEAETVRLADELLPAIVGRLRQGEFPEDVLASLCAPDVHRKVLQSVIDAVIAEEELRDSAQRAFVNIARRVQAIVHQQAQELREMEDRHGQSPEVFGDLLRIDHGTALIGRLADSIAVLGGARPGRQWSRAVPLYSVMRGAMSRIIDYQRVELHSVVDIAVVGTAVEPLIHALAELLDNATRYSPPQTKVHLTAVDVQSGIAVEIEDGGVSMSEEARGRAERMLKQAKEGIDVNDLGESPRLGLAVVGRLSQAYGFQVSLRASAYGGVRAVLIVPQDLITTVAGATGLAHGLGAASVPRTSPTVPAQRTGEQATTPARPQTPVRHPEQALPPRVNESMSTPAAQEPTASRTERAVTGPSKPQPEDDAPVVTERTANGLPQRRRKPPAAPASAPQRPTAAEQPADGAQPGLWLAAFQSGLTGETSGAAPAANASGSSRRAAQESDAPSASASKGYEQ